MFLSVAFPSGPGPISCAHGHPAQGPFYAPLSSPGGAESVRAGVFVELPQAKRQLAHCQAPLELYSLYTTLTEACSDHRPPKGGP